MIEVVLFPWMLALRAGNDKMAVQECKNYDLVLRIANLQMKMMTEQMGARMGWNWRWNLVLRAVILQGGAQWTLEMEQCSESLA